MSRIEHARPQLGLVVPGWTLRLLFALVAVALCAAVADSGLWLWMSLALTAAAVAMPRWLTAWFLIVVLSFSVLARDQSVADWRPYALIAGAHALHIIASWMLVVAPRARLQPAALWPSARRFLLVQIPVQAVAAGALALTTTVSGGALAALAVVAGVAIVLLVILLAAPLLRRPRG